MNKDLMPEVTLVPASLYNAHGGMLPAGQRPEYPRDTRTEGNYGVPSLASPVRSIPGAAMRSSGSQTQKSQSAPTMTTQLPANHIRSTEGPGSLDSLQQLISERCFPDQCDNKPGVSSGAQPWTQDELEAVVRRLNRSDDLDVVLRQLQQQSSRSERGVEQPGTSCNSSPGVRSPPRSRRRVEFAESPRPAEPGESYEIVGSNPAYPCGSLLAQQAAEASPRSLYSKASRAAQATAPRPESPWATSSSAYGAHSSAASSSSASASVSPSQPTGKARIDAARLRTLALRSAVR